MQVSAGREAPSPGGFDFVMPSRADQKDPKTETLWASVGDELGAVLRHCSDDSDCSTTAGGFREEANRVQGNESLANLGLTLGMPQRDKGFTKIEGFRG